MTGPASGTSEALLDTNVLVYAYDRSEPAKQERALSVLNSLVSAGRGVVSTQVLGEFFATLTLKLKPRLDSEDAIERLERHAHLWKVIPLTPAVVLAAARASLGFRLNHWDAQLWAAARLNGISLILSEDFSHGTSLGGVRFVNPFLPGFRVADWL